jgi:hypothetical protein
LFLPPNAVVPATLDSFWCWTVDCNQPSSAISHQPSAASKNFPPFRSPNVSSKQSSSRFLLSHSLLLSSRKRETTPASDPLYLTQLRPSSNLSSPAPLNLGNRGSLTGRCLFFNRFPPFLTSFFSFFPLLPFQIPRDRRIVDKDTTPPLLHPKHPL